MLRPPVVAGTFYEDDPHIIREFVGSQEFSTDSQARAVVVPHAGWIYSGRTALKTLCRFPPMKGFIILGPNHRGFGGRMALFPKNGVWQLPNGKALVSAHVNDFFLESMGNMISEDALAHSREHSIEVQLPFLIEMSKGDIEFCPISLFHSPLDVLDKLAISIYEFLKENSDWGLIISSDFTHYESAAEAARKDHIAIENILKGDGPGFLNAVRNEKISICGAEAVYVLIKASSLMQLKAEVVEYTNSGEVTGDSHEVVAYCGIVFNK